MNVEGEDHPVYIDPMKGWLKANNVNWDRIPAWPQIELHEDGSFSVEMFLDDVDGHTTTHRPGSWTYTHMVRSELAVPPDQTWWDAYEHNRTQALRRAELKQLARDLRFPDVEWAQVTVVIPEPGDTFMVVTASQIEPDHSASVVRQLEALLPGVNVAIVGGFETIFHKKAEKKPRRGVV